MSGSYGQRTRRSGMGVRRIGDRRRLESWLIAERNRQRTAKQSLRPTSYWRWLAYRVTWPWRRGDR